VDAIIVYNQFVVDEQLRTIVTGKAQSVVTLAVGANQARILDGEPFEPVANAGKTLLPVSGRHI